MRLSDAGYDDVKRVITLTLPGLASLMFLASYIWELPSAKFVIGLLALISLLGGICISISTKRYLESESFYDGKIVVSFPEDGPKRFSLELDGDPDDLDKKDFVAFKVISVPSPEDLSS